MPTPWRLALALAILFAAPCATQAKILDCAIKPNADSLGWIGNRSIITWDEQAGTAVVIDDIIYAFNHEKPLPATIKVVSDKQTAFSWTVSTIDSSGQNAKMFYRAVFFPADNRMIVTSKPGGYVQDYQARGTCTVK